MTRGKRVADLGEDLMESDADDLGKADRIHHWQFGFLLKLVGEILDRFERALRED